VKRAKKTVPKTKTHTITGCYPILD
jgi:hypothetical protein